MMTSLICARPVTRYAAELLDQIAIGVQLPIKLTLEDRIGYLIQRLAAGEQAAAALRLTSLILALAPDSRAERQNEEATLLSPEPQPLIRDWYYARIIEKSLGALVQAAGLDAVKLFVDLLDDAIRLSRKASENEDDGRIISTSLAPVSNMDTAGMTYLSSLLRPFGMPRSS